MARLQPQLADAVNDHYPIKQKRQPRHLKPNWDAIHWLEEQTYRDTKIQYTQSADDGLYVHSAAGRPPRSYIRPMIQIIPLDAYSGATQRVSPCTCYRFEYAWDAVRCDQHCEVEWDSKRRVWLTPERRQSDAEAITSAGEVYRRVTAAPEWRFSAELRNAEQQRQRNGTIEQFNPNTGRYEVDHRYDVIRYANPAAGEYRGVPVFSTPDVDALFAGDADAFVRFLETPNDGTFRLVVEGETDEGIRSFTIEVEDTDGR